MEERVLPNKARRRNRIRLVIAGLAVVAIAAVVTRTVTTFAVPNVPAVQAAVALIQPNGPVAVNEGCQSDHPAFYYGFADLRSDLGAVMGTPTECEHAIHANGDTRQRTTTGYAYYRKSDNIPTFTDGWNHWAITSDGLVHWSGYVVDPPTPS
jgi:hypothetical protein